MQSVAQHICGHHHHTALLAFLRNRGQRRENLTYLTVYQVPALIYSHKGIAQDQASVSGFLDA